MDKIWDRKSIEVGEPRRTDKGRTLERKTLMAPWETTLHWNYNEINVLQIKTNSRHGRSQARMRKEEGWAKG